MPRLPFGKIDVDRQADRLRQIDTDFAAAYADPRVQPFRSMTVPQREHVRKSSFAFRLDKNGDEWTLTDQDYPLRKLVSGQLVDVAPVNSPAYDNTSVGMRGVEIALQSLATKMNADFNEVRKMSEENELKRFFVRTDNRGVPKQVQPKKQTMLGASAALALLARKEDPFV